MEKILSRRTVYTGKVMSLDEVDIDFGNGKKATFELINFPGIETGVSALAVDHQNNVVLVNHFQLGAGKRLLTLPTGGLETNEDPEKRMQQELQEEIGYKVGKLTLMFRGHSLPGYIGTQPAYLYLAQDLVPSKKAADEVEDLEVVKIPIEKLLTMIKSNQILDSRVILGMLCYYLLGSCLDNGCIMNT